MTRSNVQFTQEPLAALRASQVEVLLARHWQEIAFYKDIPLEIKWAAYEEWDRAGSIRIYTARLEGALIGYACFKLTRSAHYWSSLMAIQDVLYVAPERRNARIGCQLVAYSDVCLRDEGVQVVTQHSKIAHPIDAVLRRNHYEPMETIWVKRLDGRS